jgi:hypothetical protein
MHLLLTAIIIGFTYFKGNWRQWKKYILTIQYVIICNLLYNFLCHDYMLWKYQPDVLNTSHTVIDLIYSFINLPAVTLMFLSNYPFATPKGRQVRYILLWVAGSLLIEYPFYQMERLQMLHGYKYWMEFFFYWMMYAMIRLHHTRLWLTYGLSVIIVIFMLQYFNVPIR